MKKEEIDKVFTKKWRKIENDTIKFIKTANLEVDMDVISYAYERVIKMAGKIKTEKDILNYFFQFVKFACHKTGSQYQRKIISQSQRKNKIDFEFINLDTIIKDEEEYDIEEKYPYFVIDEFFNDRKIKSEYKLTLKLYLEGLDNLTKLKNHTGIPRSTCYLYQKWVKEKLKEIYNNSLNKNKNNEKN